MDERPDALEARLTALESHLAEREAEHRDLSDMVAEQWKTIDRLRDEMVRLNGKLDDLLDRQERGGAGGEEPPPPHY